MLKSDNMINLVKRTKRWIPVDFLGEVPPSSSLSITWRKHHANFDHWTSDWSPISFTAAFYLLKLK